MTLQEAIPIVISVISLIGVIYAWPFGRRKIESEASKLAAETSAIRTSAEDKANESHIQQLSSISQLVEQLDKQFSDSIRNRTTLMSLEARVQALEIQIDFERKKNRDLEQHIEQIQEVAEVQRLLRVQYENQIASERELRIQTELTANRLRQRIAELEKHQGMEN